jgi:hypothetical protein
LEWLLWESYRSLLKIVKKKKRSFSERWPLANFVQFDFHKVSFSRVEDAAKAQQ